MHKFIAHSSCCLKLFILCLFLANSSLSSERQSIYPFKSGEEFSSSCFTRSLITSIISQVVFCINKIYGLFSLHRIYILTILSPDQIYWQSPWPFSSWRVIWTIFEPIAHGLFHNLCILLPIILVWPIIFIFLK